MSNAVIGYFFIAVVFVPYIFILLLGFRSGSTKAIIRDALAAGRYELVKINGKQYHCIRKKEIILRSPSGRGTAVLVSESRERDPEMVDGRIQLLPRWIQIRPITKKALSEKNRWVLSKGWVHYGEEEIYYHIPLKQGFTRSIRV